MSQAVAGQNAPALVLSAAAERKSLLILACRVVERGLGRIARRRWVAISLAGMLALGGSAALSLLGRMPEPEVHDEFSYLLAGDTFAHGRLTNPPHPLWIHFESFHIIQQPTYASKYPPGQGLVLAAGQVLTGRPIVGVWLSTALACAALCWMLLAWLPPWWAVLGGFLAALHPVILIQWGQHYWGGAVAVIGGALVFGALRRVVRRPRARDALLMGLGLAILANSRPYEGLIVSLPAAALLFIWMAGRKGPAAQVSIRRIVLPLTGVLAIAGVAMAFYNWRVTGDPLRMPYQVYESTYGIQPIFVWQQPRPELSDRHKFMRDVYAGAPVDASVENRPVPGLWGFFIRCYDKLWSLPYPLAILVPLALLGWLLRDRWSRFALLTCGVFAVGLRMESWFFMHYAAPITGIAFLLVLQSLRHLRVWRWQSRQAGRLALWTVLLGCVALFAAAFILKLQTVRSAEMQPRARIVARLNQAGGRHLVIVRYGRVRSAYEWVYNAADIDGSKVVWAREMDPAQNRKLLEYFKDRHAWLLEAGEDQPLPKLTPYPERSDLPAPGSVYGKPTADAAGRAKQRRAR